MSVERYSADEVVMEDGKNLEESSQINNVNEISPEWDWDQITKDVFSGMTVALALVPEAISFSFVAGVEPRVGLTAAWIMCILTGFFGGRPGMISAATGATAVVMTPFIKDHGVAHLFPAVMLCGIFQIGLGLVKVGEFSNLISEPVMVGFCNGLAIVIGYSQLELFQDGHDAGYVTGTKAWITTVEVLATMILVCGLPKLTTKVPSSLLAILIMCFVEHVIVRIAIGEETCTITDFEKVEPSFPIPFFIDHDFTFDGAPWGDYVVLALRLCFVGLIESLLTLKLIDEITQTKGEPNRECIGQGIANLVTGFFGGMGGCAMIGQSMINMNSGARLRLSSYIAGLTLFILVVVLPPVLNLIPVSSLIGVMFMVVYETFEWHSLKLFAAAAMPLQWREKCFSKFEKIKRGDVFVMLVVTVVTQLSDLAIAVIIGICLSCSIFVYQQRLPKCTSYEVDDGKTKVYDLQSPLFFASCDDFRKLFNPLEDPKRVEIHFHTAEICDYSALHAINAVAQRYKEQGTTISLQTSNLKSVRHVAKAKDLLTKIEIDIVTELDVDKNSPGLPNVVKRGKTDASDESDEIRPILNANSNSIGLIEIPVNEDAERKKELSPDIDEEFI